MLDQPKLAALLKEVARKVEFQLGVGSIVPLDTLKVLAAEAVRADAEIAPNDKDDVTEELQGAIEQFYAAGQVPHP